MLHHQAAGCDHSAVRPTTRLLGRLDRRSPRQLRVPGRMFAVAGRPPAELRLRQPPWPRRAPRGSDAGSALTPRLLDRSRRTSPDSSRVVCGGLRQHASARQGCPCCQTSRPQQRTVPLAGEICRIERGRSAVGSRRKLSRRHSRTSSPGLNGRYAQPRRPMSLVCVCAHQDEGQRQPGYNGDYANRPPRRRG